MVNNLLAEFVRVRRIDSAQKLRLLLFLYHHAGGKRTIQELAQGLYLGHTPLLENILADLQRVGLVEGVADGYILHNEPGLNSTLQCLARTLEDPLARQEILDQIRQDRCREIGRLEQRDEQVYVSPILPILATPNY
jgi:DNA-binding IscR family transcriptional regulator